MPSASFSAAKGDTALPVRSDWASGLKLRTVSAAVMIAVALVAVSAGPEIFVLLIGAGVAALAWDWTRLTGEGQFGAVGVAMVLAALGAAFLAFVGRPGAAVLWAVIASAVVYVLARGGRRSPLWAAAGPLYIGLPAIALIWLRDHDEPGRMLILWLLLTIWATDIGAFFAGRIIGGPLLAPRISPKKTWAGLIGAVVSAGVVGAVAGTVDSDAPATVLLVVAGALLAVIAQGGDLGESWVKRRFGAKDSSQLIPGHGGLFDRVDGLIAAAVILAMWQWLTGGALSWR
jgi:phosphatidate cytidylyltransferase